jgi:CHAT domain-containing protein
LLPGVSDEVAQLGHLVPTATRLPTAGQTTTHEDVVAALSDHEIAHFACHGLANWADPTTSQLILHDHRSNPLTVTDIAKLRLAGGALAYLSACSTTDTDPRHADEATHLTAAFQLAGYRSVIGTLWPINDRVATTITKQVYTFLTQGGTTPPNPGCAAAALHHATRNHRKICPNLPTQWAAYIHTGE